MTDHRNDDGSSSDDELAAEVAALDNEPESAEEQAAAAEISAMPVEGSLSDVLRSLAAEDPTVTQVDVGGATEFRARDVAFSRLEAERASFRLRREIVAAAVRTGGATNSPLGSDWVTLRPERWDRYAHDRAVSWWHLARRLAGEAAKPNRTGRA